MLLLLPLLLLPALHHPQPAAVAALTTAVDPASHVGQLCGTWERQPLLLPLLLLVTL